MQYFFVGLGNPGEDYQNSRHNTGAMVLDVFRKVQELPDWRLDKKRNALISEGSVAPLRGSKVKGQRSVALLLPQTFMNKSGDSVRGLVKTKKDAERLVVIHDDLDIPFGSYKISFNKSSGGHRGVESIIKAVKTQEFVRVRVGIASSASVVKKSQDEKTVEKIILGTFSPAELTTLKKMSKNIAEGLTVLVTEGRDKAMSQYHS
ncbi:MAG: aminoacyl-tRNA hydrolase [bacterium]|nr:aminoacyl-tRNA hydrolase [bacterium]